MNRRLILLAVFLAGMSGAVTPRPSTHRHFYNLVPVIASATGVGTLPEVPEPLFSLRLYVNGVRHKPGEDYAQAGATFTPVAGNLALYTEPTTIFVCDFDRER